MLNPELEYVAGLLKAFVTSAPVPAPADIDWNVTRKWLLGHRLMIPIFNEQLGKANAPESLKEELRTLTTNFNLRYGLLTRELYRIVPRLEDAGFEPVVLKGPALARTVYHSPTSRHFTDLDLLVRRESCDAARDLLAVLGFQPKAPDKSHYYERYHFHHRLQNAAGVLVELHWDLSRPSDFVRFELDGWFARATIVRKDGVAVRVPSDGDQLLLAAKQALDGSFTDLRRVVDAALLMKAGAESAPELAERAKRQGLATPLWVLCGLASELTGVASSASLEARIRPGFFAHACLQSMGLAETALSLYAVHNWSLGHLIRWLCAPSRSALAREVRSLVFPGTERLLLRGYELSALPGFATRLLLSAKGARTVAKACCYQAYRLAFHRGRVSAG